MSKLDFLMRSTTKAQLESFQKLKEGWDSYNGKTIGVSAIASAESMILLIISLIGVEPYPVPMNDGGVQLEFPYNGLDYEIEIDPNGEVTNWAAFDVTGEVFHQYEKK